jgi:hypothetical protein
MAPAGTRTRSLVARVVAVALVLGVAASCGGLRSTRGTGAPDSSTTEVESPWTTARLVRGTPCILVRGALRCADTQSHERRIRLGPAQTPVPNLPIAAPTHFIGVDVSDESRPLAWFGDGEYIFYGDLWRRG